MKLIIGGYAQGKLDYVLSKDQLQEHIVWDGALLDDILSNGRPFSTKERNKQVVINHFHQWVRQCMQKGRCPEEEILSFLERCEDCTIISDEIGNGIVPMDPFEREYRERVGRILIQLAQKAQEVWRVTCGIGQKIKG